MSAILFGGYKQPPVVPEPEPEPEPMLLHLDLTVNLTTGQVTGTVK